MHLLCRPIQWPWQCTVAMLSASPNTAGLWLPKMPSYATIGQIFPRITPADPMVINFGSKNWVVVLCGQKAQNGTTTQLIEATNWRERSNTTIKAEELSNFSSYQMLIGDKIGKLTYHHFFIRGSTSQVSYHFFRNKKWVKNPRHPYLFGLNAVKLGQKDLWLVLSTVGRGTVPYHSSPWQCGTGHLLHLSHSPQSLPRCSNIWMGYALWCTLHSQLKQNLEITGNTKQILTQHATNKNVSIMIIKLVTEF